MFERESVCEGVKRPWKLLRRNTPIVACVQNIYQVLNDSSVRQWRYIVDANGLGEALLDLAAESMR